jgi:hypothetical protein
LSKAAAPAVKPFVFHWKDTFAGADIHRYFSYPFSVPQPVRGIRAAVRYRSAGNYLGLGLYESDNLRSYGRTTEKEGTVELTAEVWHDENTPGAVAGPILPGAWQVEITTNQLICTCPFELTVFFAPFNCRYQCRIFLVKNEYTIKLKTDVDGP